MSNRPQDPAYALLWDEFQTTPRVKRGGCYICMDMEFARMGLPLCSPCCECRKNGTDGHIPADDTECDDCGHEACQECASLPAQADPICTCDSPCCEADVGVGIVTCGSQHCPTHGGRDVVTAQGKALRLALKFMRRRPDLAALALTIASWKDGAP